MLVNNAGALECRPCDAIPHSNARANNAFRKGFDRMDEAERLATASH